MWDRTISTARVIIATSMLGSSRLCAATIEGRAENAVRAKRASGDRAPRPAAKSEIQSEVWKSRDAKWIKLDGEGQQEATK